MTTVPLAGDERIAFVKGAAEEIMVRSTLAPAEMRRALTAAEEMEHAALRVLGLARRLLPEDCPLEGDTLERELEFVGLAGMLDPPPPQGPDAGAVAPPHTGVPDAVARCRRAGIRIVMVTGDSGRTAEAIARRIGLVGDAVNVIAGKELAQMDDDVLRPRPAERDGT